MTTDLETRCTKLVAELGLGQPGDVSIVQPLTGGVASDIARVVVAGREVCVKFALPKLKVAEDWQAPVHRNAAEFAWLEVASALFPEGGVKLFGRSPRQHGFAMEYVTGEGVYLWKSALLDEADDKGEARAVGDMLGRIHGASTASDFGATPFQNRDDFRALRIEPYLSFTAGRHPDLTVLPRLAEALYQSAQVLVHGDVSPKNILLRDGAPIMLDAECATMGDASFDPAFCLNHLVLKAVHLPRSRARLLANVAAFWEAYRAHITWEAPADLEIRVCQLLPALMLARVDGKSPVEYLSTDGQTTVRRVSRALIVAPARNLSDFTRRLDADLKEVTQ